MRFNATEDLEALEQQQQQQQRNRKQRDAWGVK
jgi:hypothetical protein